MKSITLERLTLRNFKKIKELSIDFSDNTEISGDNGTGKTTVFDAFSWLLYGKNSHNQSDFDIKTLDENNKAIPKLEHEVEGIFIVDGSKIRFKRIYSEKWVTKRGNDFEELTGHETKYFVDDVPMSKGDYELKVSDMVSESLSKILTNPMYFNSEINWKERRAILQQMAGEVSIEDIVQSLEFDGKQTDALVELLNSGSNLESEKAKIGVQKKKLKDERDLIPSRIDEQDRSIGELPDFDTLKTELSELETKHTTVEAELEDVNKSLDKQREAISNAKQQKFEKEQALKVLERQLSEVDTLLSETDTNLLRENKDKIQRTKDTTQGLTSSIASWDSQIEQLNKRRNELLTQYKEITALTPPTVESETACPSCKRELENAEEIKQTLIANFNTNKTNRLEANKREGKANNEQIELLKAKKLKAEQDVEQLKQELIDYETIVKSIEDKLNAPKETLKPTSEMIALQKEIESIVVPELVAPDVSELRKSKDELRQRMDFINRELGKADHVEKSKARIEELKNQQQTLSQEIASLEKIEFQIDAFNKSKINLVESRINSKFKLVKFKMFEQQLNGGEADACECMVNGVPFGSQNTALQINAGLDVINALQEHYQIHAPVFIDRRESVFQLQPMNCQLISLKADESAKELQVKNL